jgi:ribosomal peptide maturation radical SAM protein 1
MARLLKARDPDLLTVFGGANFDGVMGAELVRTVDCVDFAVIGEGDIALPQLLSALAAGDDPGTVPGVAHRVAGAVTVTPPAGRLDDLPVPDYDEYFERAEDLGVLSRGGHRTVRLPVETARGCWWGAKHHCTFCGLNGTTMRFRAKSPARAGSELAELARRYRSFRFEAVDNILDPDYLTTLFPALVADGTNYEIFYEVKANLTRAQLRLLRQAGVTHIQPGLESLSSAVLRLMRKGCTAAQNVNLLRWARYYGIDVSWNLLWGFPAETEADYTAQAAAIPHLTHLTPPGSAAQVWLERFSPLHAEHAGQPERSYRYVYPADVDLDQVAYFFENNAGDALPDSAYAPLQEAVRDWAAAWQADTPPVLKYWSAPHLVQIYDGRRPGHEGSHTFEGTVADLYLACGERPITARAVRDKLGLRLPVEEVEDVFGEFHRRGLMFLDGPRALALALPVARQR